MSALDKIEPTLGADAFDEFIRNGDEDEFRVWAEYYAVKWAKVGSRITCNPPPSDTDDDRLVLIEDRVFAEEALNEELGYTTISNDHYTPANANATAHEASPFKSWRKMGGELNILTTDDPEFFRRFMAATAVCQRLQLEDKQERIMLFQAVLYGNAPRVHEEIVP